MGDVALGSIAAPALVEAVGPQPAFVAVGAILPLLTVVTYRKLAEIDGEAVPVPELGLVQQVPMFQPLSVAAKERVAANLVSQSVTAGEVVIRAGEHGDCFYIVGDGELEITAEGLRTTADEGDYFGEIALLRDVPRTATVTALVDSHLYVLQRGDFLAAVTGHEAARAAGHTIAEERLSRTPGR
jgi:signal-transduction protein with cAMP-binding, CBS, and nucleotidyltransferase domain